MNKLIKWLEEEEAEDVEDILLSPVKERLDVDAFSVSIMGKPNLVKQIIRYNSQNYHKIYLICSTINLQNNSVTRHNHPEQWPQPQQIRF